MATPVLAFPEEEGIFGPLRTLLFALSIIFREANDFTDSVK